MCKIYKILIDICYTDIFSIIGQSTRAPITRINHSLRCNLSTHPLYIDLLDQNAAPGWRMTRSHSPKHTLHNGLILCSDKVACKPISLREAANGTGVLQCRVQTGENSLKFCLKRFVDELCGVESESDMAGRIDEGCGGGYGNCSRSGIAGWFEAVAHGAGEVLVCNLLHYEW